MVCKKNMSALTRNLKKSHDLAYARDIMQYAIKSINHQWLADFVTLSNDVYYNIAEKMTKSWRFYTKNVILSDINGM